MKSKLYVTAQALLLVSIFAFGAASETTGWYAVLRTLLVAGGLLLGLIALIQMRSALSILPDPTERTVLLKTGVYGVVRHPMYLSLLILSAGVLLGTPAHQWLTWLLLAAVLYAKSRYEETLLRERFPEYAAYREQVGGILPKLLR